MGKLLESVLFPFEIFTSHRLHNRHERRRGGETCSVTEERTEKCHYSNNDTTLCSLTCSVL